MRFSASWALVGLASLTSAQNSTGGLVSLLTATPELSNLTTFVQQFPQLLQTLSNATNITILAPSNAAFTKLLTGPGASAISLTNTALIQALLSYHVLTGTYRSSAIPETPAFIPTLLTSTNYTNVTGGQRVEVKKSGSAVSIYSGLGTVSNVTTADRTFTGGVVHIIDTVLTIPQNISATAAASNLTSIAGALTQANLTTTVNRAKDVTVFVPNNDAFRRIGSALPNLTTQQLTSILTYHVVNGTVGYSSSLKDGQQLTTLNGGKVTIHITGGSVYVNSAKVVLADVLVANGVVHVIDNVLNPANSTASPVPTATAQPPAFSGATSVSNAPFTSTAAGGAGATSSRATGSAATATGAAFPAKTPAVGMGALLGGAAMVLAL